MSIEEFINRPEVQVDTDSIKNNFSGKTVLVTGGAGYIGSALCHKLFEFGAAKVIAFDIDDTRLHNLWLEMDDNKSFISYLGDIKDVLRIEELFNTYNIDIVFHASAIKHVPLAELHPKETVKVNILGTSNLLSVALPKIEQFINISTDKAADAIGVMGKTKYIAEQTCISAGEKENKKVMSVRLGNIYGSRGSVVPIFENQIKNKKPIRLTNKDMKRFFISVENAILLILHACTFNTDPEDIFVFEMGEPIKIVDLAHYLMKKAGVNPDESSIQITGARPGEKISENLISQDEIKIETNHPMIYKIKQNVVSN